MQKTDTLELVLNVRQTVTVLPRCLQILSRRGFTLTQLQTEDTGNDMTVLHCTVQGPVTWHEPLIHLLQRLVDVERVSLKVRTHA